MLQQARSTLPRGDASYYRAWGKRGASFPQARDHPRAAETIRQRIDCTPQGRGILAPAPPRLRWTHGGTHQDTWILSKE